MSRQVVHDDDVAGRERRRKELLDNPGSLGADKPVPIKLDYKREKRTGPDLADALQTVLGLLAADATLPERLADHGLSGA